MEHRLTRLEVYAEVARKDQAELIRRFDKIESKLAAIDDDIKAAKIGGKVVWFIGGVIITFVAAVVSGKFLPFLWALPK